MGNENYLQLLLRATVHVGPRALTILIKLLPREALAEVTSFGSSGKIF